MFDVADGQRLGCSAVSHIVGMERRPGQRHLARLSFESDDCPPLAAHQTRRAPHICFGPKNRNVAVCTARRIVARTRNWLRAQHGMTGLESGVMDGSERSALKLIFINNRSAEAETTQITTCLPNKDRRNLLLGSHSPLRAQWRF